MFIFLWTQLDFQSAIKTHTWTFKLKMHFLLFPVCVCFFSQLCMKAKTRTQRCAECCWHMKSCAGETRLLTSHCHPRLSLSSHRCTSLSTQRTFLIFRKISTVTSFAFLILSLSLTPPKCTQIQMSYLLRKMSLGSHSCSFNYNLKMNFFWSRLRRKRSIYRGILPTYPIQ